MSPLKGIYLEKREKRD